MLTEGEVCKSYREAKDKNKQIEILSDICLCDKQDIIDILTKNGEITGIKKKRNTSVSWTDKEVQELERLYKEGIPAIQIAEKFGRNKQAIYDKARALGITKECKRKKPNAKPTSKTKDASDTDAEYIKQLETLLKEKDDELKAVTAENVKLSDVIENTCDSAVVDELKKALSETDRKYIGLQEKYKLLKSKHNCGVVEVINDLELLSVLFASLKERLPDELLERITVRIEGMTKFLRREVDFDE